MLDADLFQVDTEGYDATILDMIDFARFRPRADQIRAQDHEGCRAAGAHDRRLAEQGSTCVAEGTERSGWPPARR